MSRFESSPVTREFLKKKQAHLPDFQGKILAGVSGGPDSMALLYLLYRNKVNTVVVHVNYQLRRERSDKDQHLVEEMSHVWGFDCVAVRLDADERGSQNFQAWARDRRYQVFRDVMKEFDATYILTAHHQDDQVETILQKILRGSGLASLKGMDVLEEDLFRPLIDIPKKQIMKFVENFNIPYRIDGSNEESTYARNFIRNQWFPDMERLFPGWKQNILNLQRRAGENSLMADHILGEMLTPEGALQRDAFLDLDPGLRPALLLHWIKKTEPELSVSKGFLLEADNLSDLQSGAALMITGTREIMRDRNTFVLVGTNEVSPVHVVINEKDLSENGVAAEGYIFKMDEPPETFGSRDLYLDFDQLKFPLTLRNWKSSDAFIPLGMSGTQLLSDHLTNRKISSAKKKEAKVVQTFDGIICAVIFPHNSGTEQPGTIAHHYRCTSSTRKTITIRRN